MPILKNLKVDEFDNVTVLVVKDISMRSKKVGENIHVVISEADKSDSEVALRINETQSLAKSDKVHNIDMIIDIPTEKALDQLISYFQELKQEHYT